MPIAICEHFYLSFKQLDYCKLDYCNSILYNIPNRELNKLQSFHYCLTRDVTRSPRFCSVTPLLKSLHWLPVQYRIKYKIWTLTYKVRHKCQPVYLQNPLKPLNRTRIFCSSDDDQLVVPRVSSKKGERAFSVAAPKLWNCIPLEIKKSKSSQSFRKKWQLYISANLFHPKSSASRHAGSTNWNSKWTMSLIRICNASELGTPRI